MSPSQKDIFLDGAGNGWFERNQIIGDKLAEKVKIDPVLKLFEEKELLPKKILEIGASNGWRLSVLNERFPEVRCVGIDPSEKAVCDAFPDIEMHRGTADLLPFQDNSFDVVIFGFCLYLCDRADLFRIASEADRVLADGGCMIIYDFYSEVSYRNPYAHLDGVYSYKMDYSRLFTWNPLYELTDNILMPHPGTTDNSPDNQVCVSLLYKKSANQWPDKPGDS